MCSRRRPWHTHRGIGRFLAPRVSPATPAPPIEVTDVRLSVTAVGAWQPAAEQCDPPGAARSAGTWNVDTAGHLQRVEEVGYDWFNPSTRLHSTSSTHGPSAERFPSRRRPLTGLATGASVALLRIATPRSGSRTQAHTPGQSRTDSGGVLLRTGTLGRVHMRIRAGWSVPSMVTTHRCQSACRRCRSRW